MLTLMQILILKFSYLIVFELIKFKEKTNSCLIQINNYEKKIS